MTYAIEGHVAYYSNGQPVNGVSVTLQGPTPASALTDATGEFLLTNLGQANAQIEPTKVGDAGGAISALDAVAVLQIAVGQITAGAEQRLACDVDGDGAVTAFDAVLILQYATGVISAFPAAQSCGSGWAFVPVPATASNQRVVEPLLASPSCQSGTIAFEPLIGPATGQDFSAVLIGDCTGNWQPTLP